MGSRLEIGFELDRHWHLLRGEVEKTKELALLELARALEEAGVTYALIGGVALQARLTEPRTSIDIEVAVLDRATIPRDLLLARGFLHTGSLPQSEKWTGPGDVPVQFTDDPLLAGAVARAGLVPLAPISLRVAGSEDLLHAKLRAAADPARRRLKRTQDLSDALALLEQDPALDASLTEDERRLLDAVPR